MAHQGKPPKGFVYASNGSLVAKDSRKGKMATGSTRKRKSTRSTRSTRKKRKTKM